MHTLPISELKIHLTEIIEKVGNGEEFVISLGNKKNNIAAIIPFKKFTESRKPRKIGLLKGKAGFRIAKDFKITDTDFLQS